MCTCSIFILTIDSQQFCFSLLYLSSLLQDNIPSVRQGAAIAIGNVVRAYGKDVLPMIIEKMKEGLKGNVQ